MIRRESGCAFLEALLVLAVLTAVPLAVLLCCGDKVREVTDRAAAMLKCE